jgi:pyrimidine operon attenuation protein/uracil phosphoribosyltransferase
MDAMQQFGRPSRVELLVLVDRRFSRHVPVQPDYVGFTVDALFSEKVIVQWSDDLLTADVTLTRDE